MDIIQWNINGYYNNFSDLQRLICDYDPSIICLQETHLSHFNTPTLRHFSVISNHLLNPVSSGGTAICISNKKGIGFEELTLESDLDAVAVKLIVLGVKLTICSVYLKPNSNIEISAIQSLINELPQPFLLLGDFNSHNEIWGSNHTSSRGRMIENIILSYNLNIMNTGSHTYYHPGYRTFSSIDLSICSPAFFPQFSWVVLEDYHSSDHFPIKISKITPSPDVTRRQRWKEYKADWPKFSRKIVETMPSLSELNVHDAVSKFTETVQSAANECIPKTSPHPKKRQKAWWNDDIDKLAKECKKAYKKACNNLTEENDRNYKTLKAEFKRQCKEAKIKTWQDYIITIDDKTSSKDVWNKVRRIQGTYNTPIVKQVFQDGRCLTNPIDIGNSIALNFQNNSQDDDFDLYSLNRRLNLENAPLELNLVQGNDSLNIPFSRKEMEGSLITAKGKSPGPDSITYSMLKNLDFDTKSSLLAIYNRVFQEGVFPDQWKEASVVPILKPGKDPTSVLSYRPISLLNCTGKIFEKMIARRLSWWLERHQLLSTRQNGFRNSRSTSDNVTILQNFVASNRQLRKHTIAVSLDISKAYEKVWSIIVTRQLAKWGVSGTFLDIIQDFMRGRSFKVLIGSHQSDSFLLTNGVPQGSSLSVLLFLVAINGISEVLENCEGVEFLMYADDIIIYASDSNYEILVYNVQNSINQCMLWARDNGFSFSSTKTEAIHFCHKRICPDPNIAMGENRINFSDNVKILGIYFDKKLNLNYHVNQVKNKVQKSINLINTLAHTRWGANQTQLLKVSSALIDSRIFYGSTVLSTANNTTLNKLDPIRNSAIRAATGAFRSSPIGSIQFLSSSIPSDVKRVKINGKFMIKNIANNLDLSLTNIDLTHNLIKPTPFLCRIQNDFLSLQINNSSILKHDVAKFAPWLFKEVCVNLSLAFTKKSLVNSNIFRDHFSKVIENYKHYTRIYTDGSKSSEGVGYAFLIEHNNYNFITKTVRMDDRCSVFTAEARAILDGCEYPWKDNEKRLIISDSKSVIEALKSISNRHPIICKIRDKFIEHYPNLRILWVPSHVGIANNEKVDELARQAASRTVIDENSVPINDLNNYINERSLSLASDRWNRIHVSQGLASLSLNLETFKTQAASRNREERVILNRLVIGHTRLTHGYLMSKENPPICDICEVNLTIAHIFTDCAKYFVERESLNLNNCDSIIRFIKNIGLYKEI